MFCRSLFSDTLGRIPRGIHTGNSNVLCVLLHFSLCVKPPCSFVMRLPNRLDCSMEVFLPTLFLFTPGRTRGFVKPEGTNKGAISRMQDGTFFNIEALRIRGFRSDLRCTGLPDSYHRSFPQRYKRYRFLLFEQYRCGRIVRPADRSCLCYGAGGVPGRGEIPMSSVSSRTPVDFLLRIWGMRSS